ncbi:MAG TPA: hypothetical protein PKD45_00575 [Flavobacteriales bacterium]|nr:hypothetical protein [Flavobacteriales bacterium]
MLIIGMAILMVACGKQPETGAININGEWDIVQIDPPFPHFEKDTLGLEGLALLLIASKGDSLLPAKITIDKRNMVLKSNTLSLDTLGYSISGEDEEGYKLETADGTWYMKLGAADDATLSKGGVTYRLRRAGQQE